MNTDLNITFRPYQSKDCGQVLRLFYDTVHRVNAAHYSQEQLDVWAPRCPDRDKWNQSLLSHHSILAFQGDTLAGFGDIDSTGYLDRLYVHADYQGLGIASAICDKLEGTVPGDITVHASITARPFFEQRGYQVLKEQQVERQGVFLANYIMVKKR